MKTFKNFVLILPSLFAFITLSCNEKMIDKEVNKCDSNPCVNLSGFDCVDGVCFCPQGKYKMGIFCSALNANEYYGTSSCSSLDTIRIDFGQAQQVDERIATVLSTKTFGTQMNGSRFRDNSQKLDSLVLPFPRTYLKDTVECTVLATGRFLDNNNLKLNLKYFAVYQNNRLVGNCEMILYK